MKNHYFHASILLCLLFISACKDDDGNNNCNSKVYIPESQLSWLPYYKATGEATENNFITLENDTVYLVPQTLLFQNTALDSANWKLVYVTDGFEKEAYEGCPNYQKTTYTLYNNDLSQHIDIGFSHQLSGDGTNNGSNTYVPVIAVWACDTKGENNEGLLYGDCLGTSFNVDGLRPTTHVTKLDTFSTLFSTYNDVFYATVNQNASINYNFYLAKDHGIIAYEKNGVLWSLVE